MQGRQQTKQQTSDNRQHCGETQHSHIELSFTEPWILGGYQLHYQINAEPGEQNTGGGSQEREQKTLEKELAYQPRAPGAQRCTDCNFLASNCMLGQQESGDVGAGNQE